MFAQPVTHGGHSEYKLHVFKIVTEISVSMLPLRREHWRETGFSEAGNKLTDFIFRTTEAIKVMFDSVEM